MATNPDPNADSYIAAGASLLGQAGNIAAAAAADRRGRKWAEKQYERQRRDALTDWMMQNEYNSPAAQMARLSAAKLNPRLIYGNSSNMPAATSVRSSDSGSYRPVVPNINVDPVVNNLLSSYDLRMKTAQIDNLEATKDVLIQDKILKSAQTAQIGQSTARTEFDLNQARLLQTNTIEQANANLQKTYADTQFTLDANERAAALQGHNVGAAIENVLNLRANRAKTQDERDHIKQQIKNLKKDEQLKSKDLELKKAGIQPHDPAWMRVLIQNLDRLSAIPGKVKSLSDAIQNFPLNPLKK